MKRFDDIAFCYSLTTGATRVKIGSHWNSCVTARLLPRFFSHFSHKPVVFEVLD